MVTISYPASPSRIIVLVKTLQHIIENLEDERKARSLILEKTKRKQSFFDYVQWTKKARKPFDVLQRVWPRLIEFNKTSPGERRGVAFEKCAEFIGSGLS